MVAAVSGVSLRSRIFYGWWVVAASAVGLGCSTATLIAATFAVYVGPLRTEFAWRATDVYLATLLVNGAATLASPFIGMLVDRIGPRRVIIPSMISVVMILASFYFLHPSLPQFYLRYVLLGVLGVGATHVGFGRVISLWFDRRRGLALGIALSGIGIGGFLWPIFCQYLIGGTGWRLAYLVQAGVIAAVALPLVAWIIRDAPESLGLAPDGATARAPAASAGVEHVQRAGLSLRVAVRGGPFWLILIAYLVIGFALQSVMLHLVPLLVGRGVAPMMAALAQSSIFLALIFGRLASGWLIDRVFAPRVAIAFLVAPVAGMALLALGVRGGAAFIAALLVGLAAGGEVDVLAYLSGRYYGLRHFSAIYGTLNGLYALGAGLGGPVTAWIAEGPGGYAPALWFDAGLLLIASVLLSRLGPFPRWG